MSFLLLTCSLAWSSRGRGCFPTRRSQCPAQCLAMKSRQPGVKEQANQWIIKCKCSSSMVGFKHLKETVNAKCLPSSSFSISTKHLSFQHLQEIRVPTVCQVLPNSYLILTMTIWNAYSHLHAPRRKVKLSTGWSKFREGRIWSQICPQLVLFPPGCYFLEKLVSSSSSFFFFFIHLFLFFSIFSSF